MHMVVKGRRRDSDWYSIIEDEWPSRRDALQAWLAPENFAPDGTMREASPKSAVRSALISILVIAIATKAFPVLSDGDRAAVY